MTENIIAWRMTPIEGVCRGFTDDPNVAEKWRKAGCVVEPLVLVIGHPQHHLDASKWPSKAAMEASHAHLSADTTALRDVLELVEYQRRRYQDVRLNFKQMDLLLSFVQPQTEQESAVIAAIDPFTRGAFTGWMHKSGDDMITLDEAEDHFSLCMADMMEAAREAASQPSPAATVETKDLAIEVAQNRIAELVNERDAALSRLLPHSSAATGDDEFRACQLHWPEPYGSTIGRAADEIDRLRHDIERHIQIASDEAELAEFYANSRPVNESQAVEVPFANMQFMGGDKSEYAVIRAEDWQRFTGALTRPAPQIAPQPTLVIGPNTTGGDENFAPESGLNYSAARLLLWFKSWDEAVQFNAALTRAQKASKS